ncbi:MAG TPA: cytochrome c oxidase assembly protein [Rhodanobacteraceae bacterium]
MSHLWTQWNWEPWLLACIAITTVPYLIGIARMDREQRRRILGRWRALSFLAGIAVLLLALESPLDGVADDLFSAHMLQHMLLLLVIPPLLVAGRPVITWLWAFNLDARRGMVRGWTRAGLQSAFRVLLRPLVVWVLLTIALCFWHLPGPYGWALHHEWVHDLEHLSFLALSLAFWTIVIEPYGRRRALGYGGTIVFVVSSGFVMSLIGAILTLAPHPVYAVHLDTARYGLTALADQQLAGIIMWIPSNLIHLGALCAVFFAWFHADARGAPQFKSNVRKIAMHSLLVVPLVAIGLGGCARSDPDAQRGAQLIDQYGCGACHTIPGIGGADGLVGPPLTHWSQRSTIAGVLPNDPDNLAMWISHPQHVLPGVDMPEMGVSEQDARYISAYLYTIR